MNKNIHKIYCLNDIQAFIKYKDYNYVYNKFNLTKKQNISCNIAGIYPNETQYPIVMKPIINLFGMSRNVQIIENEDEYTKFLENTPHPSSFWMPYYEANNHFTIDILFKKGEIIYSNTFQSSSTKEIGIFNKHEYIQDYVLNKNISHFLEEYLGDYTGCVNIEVMDEIIIEIHLRFNGDNFIYKENPIILDYLDDILNNDVYKIEKPKQIECNYYCYIPFFIDDIKNYSYEKECIEKEINQFKIKNSESSINVYYDNIEGLHQQEKKRYCMITLRK